MKFWNVLTQKTIALVLATFIFSLPLTSIAAAKDRHDAPPPPRDREDHDKDDNGNAVTGFIIGAAVGAIVAKNT